MSWPVESPVSGVTPRSGRDGGAGGPDPHSPLRVPPTTTTTRVSSARLGGSNSERADDPGPAPQSGDSGAPSRSGDVVGGAGGVLARHPQRIVEVAPVRCGCCADTHQVGCDDACWYPREAPGHTHPCVHCAGDDWPCPVCGLTWRHGTDGAYTNHRCRCRECRAAHRAGERSRTGATPHPPSTCDDLDLIAASGAATVVTTEHDLAEALTRPVPFVAPGRTQP